MVWVTTVMCGTSCFIWQRYNGTLCGKAQCQYMRNYKGSWPCKQGSWGQLGAHPGPTGPRWAPCWPHEPCYLGTALCRNTPSIYNQVLLVPGPIQHDFAYNMAAVKKGNESITKLTKEIPQLVLKGCYGVSIVSVLEKNACRAFTGLHCATPILLVLHVNSTVITCLFHGHSILIPQLQRTYSIVVTCLFDGFDMSIPQWYHGHSTIMPCLFCICNMLIPQF